MNEQLGESLSALMDGEAGAADIERVLDNIQDPALRALWRRAHAARDSQEPGAVLADLDLSGRIMAAVEQEPAHLPVATVADDDPASAVSAIQPVARFHRFLRPLASFAVAASVTAAALLGSQYYGLLEAGAGPVPRGVAENTLQPERGSPVTLLGGTATLAGYGYAVPAQSGTRPESVSATDYNAMARERLRRYMLPHAEEASLNTPRGMMPYAKVATFETEE